MGHDKIGPKEAQQRAMREAKFEARQKQQLKASPKIKAKPVKAVKRGRSR